MEKSNKKSFEKEFDKALRSYGYGFPETPDEVERFESQMDNLEIPSLPILENPSDILKRGEVRSTGNIHKLYVDHSAVQNLAMAAREGKAVSNSTKKKMLQDRRQSEKNKEG